MKIILLFDTAINTSNLGDEIIFQAVKDGMADILDDAMTFRYGTHVINYSELQLIRKDDFKIKTICNKADYKLICGTNLLLPNLKVNKPQWMLNPFNARLYDRSILVGVGRGGEFKYPNRYTAKLYKRILAKDIKHSVRDEETKKLVERLGFQALNTGCPTLWGLDEEFCASIPKGKAKNVVFSVSGYAAQRDCEADKRMIDIVNAQYDKKYVWIQTSEDERYLEMIRGEVDCKPIYSLNRYKKILQSGTCDYVGTRLHGGIFALQNRCRSIIISIDERAEGFKETNNLPTLNRKNIDVLGEMINESWETHIINRYDEICEFKEQFV